MRPTLLVLAALMTAAPLHAQRSERHLGQTSTYVSEEHDGRREELRMIGRVEFNEEGSWVVSVFPASSLRIEERGRGVDRRLEFTRALMGGVRVRYWENGDERAMNAESRAWAGRMVLRAVREGGLGASRRVARIRAREGVDGVLDEIALIGGDTGKRLYYTALLQGEALSNAEFDRVMADAARRLSSDTETRLVLFTALEQAGGSAARQTAVIRALSSVDSDTEVRLVLFRALELSAPRDPGTIQAFFRAVSGLSSNTERRLVLTRLAEGGLTPAMREPFFAAVEEMSSDTERRLVLSRVLSEQPRASMVVSALRAAASMRSDTEKRLVLSQVPSQHLGSDVVVAAYRQVLRTMSSDSERSLALRRLASES